MRLIATLLIACSLALSACVPPRSAGDVTVVIDRVAADWAKAKAWAQLLLPFLPADRAAQAQSVIARGDQALAVAEAASTIAEQLAARDQLEAATRTLDQASTL